MKEIPVFGHKSIPLLSINKILFPLLQEKYRNTECRGLSGGTKRKVCTAIAFMGNPQLILMDEPTSGMDALTKRLVWAQIQRKIFNTQQHHKVSIILTSHSMEECEVLCSRLAIMVEGKFRCLGTPTHIKQKFGRGYSISLLFKNETDMEKGHLWVTKEGPFADSHENVSFHNTTLNFRVCNNITSTNINMLNTPSVIFSHILKQRKFLRIQDFSVKHTTLDEVFVGFAKSEEENGIKKDVKRLIENRMSFEENRSGVEKNTKSSKDNNLVSLSSACKSNKNKTNDTNLGKYGHENVGYDKVITVYSHFC